LEIIIDESVKLILETMQSRIPTNKLIGVADCLPQMARLLWKDYPQEPCSAISLRAEPLSIFCEKKLAATE